MIYIYIYIYAENSILLNEIINKENIQQHIKDETKEQAADIIYENHKETSNNQK